MKPCPKPPPKTTHPQKISQVPLRVWSMQASMISQKSSCSTQPTTTHPPQSQDQVSMAEAPTQTKPMEAPRINHPRRRHHQFKPSKRMWYSSYFKLKIGRMRPSKTKLHKRQSKPEFNRRLRGSIKNQKVSQKDI
jgi:hypothetical protein